MSSEETQSIREQLNRIERCLTGDEAVGQTGLVKSHASHDARISKLENWGVRVAGGVFVIGIFWTVWSQWPRN